MARVRVDGIGIPDADSYYERIRGESSLVAYFPLTQSVRSGRVLDTHGGRLGDIAGAPTVADAGVPYGGKAMTFSGTDYFTVPYTSALNPAAFTIEFWINTSDATGNILFNRPATTSGYAVYTSAGSIYFQLQSASGSQAVNVALPSATWVHVACVYDGTNASIYLNGVLSVGPTARLYVQNASANFCFGSNFGATPIEGDIAHVAFYNAALSQAKINRHYSAFADAVLRLGPVGYWRLNEASGTTAVDLSGNGNDGVYTNTPTLGVAGGLADDPSTSTTFTRASAEYVEVAYDAAVNPDEFTKVIRFKTGTTGVQQTLISNQDVDGSNIFGAQMYIGSNNELLASVAQGTTTRIFPDSNVVVTDDSWHEAVLVHDGSTCSLYMDGSLVSGPLSVEYAVNDDGPFRIASQGNNTTTTHDGEAQEAILFDRALTATEISELYKIGVEAIKQRMIVRGAA